MKALPARLRAFFAHKAVTPAITALILLNAVLLGLQTSQTFMTRWGEALILADTIILGIFVAELAAKMIAYGRDFPKSGWNVFDTLVVGISLLPLVEGLAVLRALRVLRVLRLISILPQMRRVVQALLSAIPGMGTVMALLLLIFYVGAVIATNLFGESFPQWFGDIGSSLYSLFQIMTLESWSMGIARPVMQAYPYAWAFFVPFILITSFAVLNLFVAIIVDSMAEVHRIERAENLEALADLIGDEEQRLIARMDTLSQEFSALKEEMERRLRKAG
ncbi:MAG: ion transporter [Rhodothalassiaceae bacterium]